MFEDSLLESGGRLKKRNPWATAMSFAIEFAGVGLLVLVPLIYTEALPVRVMWQTSEVLAPPSRPADPPPQPQPATGRTPSGSNFVGNVLVLPDRIPPHAATIVDVAPPSNVPNVGSQGPCVGCVLGDGRGVSTIIADAMRPPHVQPVLKQATRTTLSTGVSEGLLIRRVTPEYPTIAKQTRTQGRVVLAAVIGRDGTIQNLQVMSGHPLLVGAAVEAVKQWRYRPYLLNGQPVEVETNVTVNFTLN